jgi:hypothetical protein
MRVCVALGIAASLACISAAEPPQQWQTYGGVRVDSDQRLLTRYDRTYRHCVPEAIRRGSTDTNSLLYVAALRSCMYRYAITDRGAYAYPANAPFIHFLDR